MPARARPRPSRVLAALAACTAAAGLLTAGCAPPSPEVTPATPRAVLGFAVGGGLPYETPRQRDADLDGMAALGARWVRLDVEWARVQPDGPDRSDWTALDATVRAAGRRGLQVLGTLAYAPPWARDPACRAEQMCRPADPQAYGAFAAAAAAHLAPLGVHHWEVWNEPNVRGFFRPAPDPVHYTAMLRAARTALHASDPQAVVVSGGLSPAASADGDLSPVDFLDLVYRAGGAGAFDALGHHPYCYEGGDRCPTTRARWSAWAQLADTRRNLRLLMSVHGDAGKQIWVTEFGAPTGGPTAVSEPEQARMLTAGLALLAEQPWAGPVFVYAYRDAGTDPSDREDWFGVVTHSGRPKVAARTLAGLVTTAPGASGTPSATPT